MASAWVALMVGKPDRGDSAKSQLKTINEILKIEGMTVTAYQLITEIGWIIYLKNQQSSLACSNCGHLSDRLHLLGATHAEGTSA
jgi:hypothetical protein